MNRNDYPADAAPPEASAAKWVLFLFAFVLVFFAFGVAFCRRFIDAQPW